MTAHPSTTILPIETESDIQDLELAHREQEIAWILRECLAVDREYRRIDAFVDAQFPIEPTTLRRIPAVVAKPATLLNVIATIHGPAAQLAVVLHDPIAKLVDACLDVDDEWSFRNWSPEKQAQKIQALFEDAGIADRFVTPDWASDEGES